MTVQSPVPPSFRPMQRPISSLLPFLIRTTINNDHLLRDTKGRRSLALQLWPSLVNNFEIKISDLPTLSHCDIEKETRGRIEARRRKETGGCNRPMTLNDDVLAGKYTGVCDVCDYHHNVLLIELESGNHIRTKPFSKGKATIKKARPDLLGFWDQEAD
jgi:hypothetical protein